MHSFLQTKKFSWLAISSFFLCGLWSLLTQEIYWLTVPFFLVAAVPVFQLIVTKTEWLYWLLLITLPLSTEYNFTPSLGLDLPDEPLLIILSVAVIASMLFNSSPFRFIIESPISKWIIAILICMCISLSYAPNQWLALKFILAKIWYILPLVVLTALIHLRSSNYTKTALYLCLPLIIVVIQTIVRHAFYGFDFVAIKKTMGPFFRNHVNYSAMLVCLFPIGILLLQFTQHTRKKNIIQLGLIIGALGLFFAYSRGAWLALLVGMIGYFLIKKNILGKSILISTIALMIGLISLINNNRFMQFAPEHDETIFHENFAAHLNATIGLKDISNAERFHRWVAGVRMVAAKPWTGFGANSFYNHYQPYTISAFKTWVSNNPEHSTVHNYYLLLALEQGLPALILFVGFFIYLLLLTQQLYHQFQQNYYREISMSLGIVLMMIASLNFTSDLIETDKIGGLFWLTAGILISLKHHQKIEKESLAILAA